VSMNLFLGERQATRATRKMWAIVRFTKCQTTAFYILLNNSILYSWK